MNIDKFIQNRQARTNDTLQKLLSLGLNSRLSDAMRYTVLNGGKRIRPLLVYAAGESLDADLEALDIAAAAVEFIHAYSLIHDDLPAMDDDDFRRGQPSCHKAFDEATAILAGDALQAFAYHLLASHPHLKIPAEQRLQMITTLSHACGPTEMVLGQAIELELKHSTITESKIESIHQKKTGALFVAALHLGALSAPNPDTHKIDKILNFGKYLGYAFQLQDDLFDHHNPKKHETFCNYASNFGFTKTTEKIKLLFESAHNEISELGELAHPLRFLSEYLLTRES